MLLCTNTIGSSLSGDVEETPGPFTQVDNNKEAPCAKQVDLVSLLESILSELGRIPVNVLGDGNCFFHAVSCQLYNTLEYHLHIRSLGVQAPVVRKPINANPRLNRPNPRSKFILRLNSVPRRPISTIQGLN